MKGLGVDAKMDRGAFTSTFHQNGGWSFRRYWAIQWRDTVISTCISSVEIDYSEVLL